MVSYQGSIEETERKRKEGFIVLGTKTAVSEICTNKKNTAAIIRRERFTAPTDFCRQMFL